MPLPIAGSGLVATTNTVTQGQVNDHPSQATKTSNASQDGHDCGAKSKGRTFSALSSMVQHLIVVHNNMLAIAVNSSSKHALSRGVRLKNICRTVQVLPECLRLSKVPAVHCNIAATMGQP